MLSSDRGQATTAALILLPLALAVCCALMVLAFAFAFEANATAACRASMAESQNESADALNQLLDLNPVAEGLESKRQAAQVALTAAEASLYPPAIAAAAAVLQAVQIAQIPVMARQSYLHAKGKIASLRTTAAAADALAEKVPSKLLTMFPQSTSVPRFNVTSSPPGARTPTYRTAPNFNRSQEGRVRWLLKLSIPRLSIDRENDFDFDTAIEVGCAMTLEKKGNGRWEPQITEDKLLRN